jgi:hypothetical protein
VARPAPVRIDDLASPTYPPEIAALRESIVPMAEGIRLEPGFVLDEARSETGLADFGDPGFEERLDVLLRSVREEARLSPFGVINSHGLIVQLLKNRLLLQDLLRRHPEIHDVQIERPIVIAGLPRTGTTHLHNLLAADPALRSLPYWESLEPVLPPGAEDLRRERTAFALDIVNQSMPLFERMHEMTVDHAHEEIQLLAMDFSSMLFETTSVLPSWRDFYLAHDQTPHYEYLKTALKALQWLRGGTRWVLKSPQHMEQLAVLMRVFPDATIAICHRDPVAVTASVTMMLAYSSRMHTDAVDPVAVGAYWAPRIEQLLGACLRDRALVPDAQSIDVRFHEFMADDMAMVERIYAVADQPLPDTSRTAMRTFLDAHPRGRFGTVDYDLEQFGLTPAQIASATSAYTEAFALQ